MSAVSITRKLLYGQVWSEPMRRLAKGFGISDVGLAKICRKHKIPCPPRGYWAKKAAGQTPYQIPLPNPADDCTIEIRDSAESSNGRALSDELQQQVANQNGKGFQIELRDHLRGSHPLVSQANQELQAASQDSEGMLILPEKAPLALRVSKSTLRRALFVMDALLRALENRGDAISPGPRVVLLEVPVQFSITEAFETRREEETDSADLSGPYQFGHSNFRSKRVPSGRLTFQIESAERIWLSGCRRVWRDTPKQPLERRLESILAGLVEFAARVRQERENRRREEQARVAAEQRRKEEARQRALKRAAIQAERKRFDDLVKVSKRWKQCQTLREYIEAEKRRYLAEHRVVEPDSEMAQWLEWASRQADWLDPLTDSPPSLLDEDVGDEVDQNADRSRRW